MKRTKSLNIIWVITLLFSITSCGVKKPPLPAISSPNPFEVELSKPSSTPSPTPKK